METAQKDPHLKGSYSFDNYMILTQLLRDGSAAEEEEGSSAKGKKKKKKTGGGPGEGGGGGGAIGAITWLKAEDECLSNHAHAAFEFALNKVRKRGEGGGAGRWGGGGVELERERFREGAREGSRGGLRILSGSCEPEEQSGGERERAEPDRGREGESARVCARERARVCAQLRSLREGRHQGRARVNAFESARAREREGDRALSLPPLPVPLPAPSPTSFVPETTS